MADTRYTLYIKNLTDQLPLAKLRQQLYVLFSTYGELIEINTSPKERGQAFIVFAEAQNAKKALRDLQDTVVFGKQLKIEYAKTESTKVAALEL